MKNDEALQKQTDKQKPSRKKYIIASGIMLLLVTAALVLILLTQEPKPDPASEAYIRRQASQKIDKEPNELTDEDFAQIKELGLGVYITILGKYPIMIPELSDIRLVEKFSNLKVFALGATNYPANKIPKWMSLMAKFGFIDIKERFAIDLSPLKKLKSLETLSIYHSSVKNIKPLAGLTNVRELYLMNTLVFNLKPVKEMTKLKTLDISNTMVSDLEPIIGLKNLEVLIINDTLISNIEPLKNLINLRILSAYNTQISDLEPLREMKDIQQLYIYQTKISDLEPLKGLKNLKELYIGDTQVSSLEPLKELLNLQKLEMVKCVNVPAEQIEDLQKALPNLKIHYN
jgi:hypothetical protein